MSVIARNTKKQVSVPEQQKSSVSVHRAGDGGSAEWGRIYGDIKNQADLMAAIQEAKDWAVVGWVL